MRFKIVSVSLATYSSSSHVDLPSRDVVRNVSVFIDCVSDSTQSIVTAHRAKHFGNVFANLVASPALQDPLLN